MKKLIKNILGPKLLQKIAPVFHGIRGWLWAMKYSFPGKKLSKIGITGTKGKTTTTMYIGRMMNLSGIKTGFISTGSIYLGDGDIKLNQLQADLLEISKIEKLLQKNSDYTNAQTNN